MFEHQHLQMLSCNLSKYELLHPFEVVGHRRETQLQVGEHLNKKTSRENCL